MPSGRAPTFGDTADYFQARAAKARDDHRRAEFVDTARFYRSLGQITATFPYGYKTPDLRRGTSGRLNKRAEECKAIAALTRDPECRAKLLRLAESYEQVSRGPAIAAG